MTGRTYRRRFLLLGGVCLLLLLGSMLVGRYGLSVDKLLHMLWTRLTGGAADWSVSDEKVVFAIRLPRIAAAAAGGCGAGRLRHGLSGNVPQPHGVAGYSGGLHRRRLRRSAGYPAGGRVFRHLPGPPSASACWPWRRRGW